MSKIYTQILCGLVTFNVYLPMAHATESLPNTNDITPLTSSFVMTLSGGSAWESAGQTQTLTLAPGMQKTYTANEPTNTLIQGELFLGIQTPLTKILQGQLGLAFGSTSNATLSGDIWDDADPEFDNYTYKYQLRHKEIALKGKLLGDWGWGFMPWVSASMGVGYNRAYSFTNTPTIYEALPSSDYAGNTTTAFTYTLGIGIQRALTQHWQMGAGYEFSDWGKSELGLTDGQTTNNSLSLSHVYTHAFLLNLTFIA